MTPRPLSPGVPASLRLRAAQGAGDPALAEPLAIARRASAAIKVMTSTDAELAELKFEGTRIRKESVNALPRSVFELKESLERRGFRVHYAADATSAASLVVRIARERGVRSVVKSKSMATEEIALNEALEAEGIEVTETDLGEFIVQLAGEPPAHILAPAINKTASAVARLFLARGIAEADEVSPDDPDKERLTAIARRWLRSRFLAADMGVTGANFACAREGVLVGLSNEGNLRMCVSLPRIHVAVVPVEKIVPSLRAVATLLPLLTRTATGQPLTSYVSLIAGPRKPGEVDGPEESHVVLLDNSRTSLVGSRYESVLRCVRCGACLNACPVYTAMGGHAYGTTYMGPIGAVLATLVEEGGPTDLPFASTLCGACTEICPVSIPLHEMLYDLRIDPRRSKRSATLRASMRLWSEIWARPRSRRLFRAAASLGARLALATGAARLDKDSSPGKRLAFADNALGRAGSWATRRSAIPFPEHSSPSAFATPPRPSQGGGGRTHRSADPSPSPAPGDSDRDRTLSGKERTLDRAELLVNFKARATQNGLRVHVVARNEEAIAQVLGRLLEGVRTAAVDPSVLEGPVGSAVDRIVSATEIEPVPLQTREVAPADCGISTALAGVAATGSLVLRFAPSTPRITSLLPPRLVVAIAAEDVVAYLDDAFERLTDAGIVSGAALISGPSKTADIEMTLVNGVHGPAEVAVVLLTDQDGES